MKKALGLISEINGLLNIDFHDLQSFDMTFKNWKINEKRMIEGTSNVCVKKSPNHLRFLTEIPPLGKFPEHFHDCIEVMTVVSGKITDLSIPDKIYKISEQVVIQKFQRHIPYNPDPSNTCYLIVDFYRNK